MRGSPLTDGQNRTISVSLGEYVQGESTRLSGDRSTQGAAAVEVELKYGSFANLE